MQKVTVQIPIDRLFEAVRYLKKSGYITLPKEKTNGKLTLSEIGILGLVLEGYTSVEIGKKLKINNRTVDDIRNNIFKKAKVRNTIQLFRYALQKRYIKSSELFSSGKIKRKRSPLSPNETKVLLLIIKGLSSNEIAAKLKRAPKTIQTYRERLFKKTGTANRVLLVRYAFKNRLV